MLASLSTMNTSKTSTDGEQFTPMNVWKSPSLKNQFPMNEVVHRLKKALGLPQEPSFSINSLDLKHKETADRIIRQIILEVVKQDGYRPIDVTINDYELASIRSQPENVPPIFFAVEYCILYAVWPTLS